MANGSGIVTCSVPMCYRVVASVTNAAPPPTVPAGMVAIPAGTNSGTDPDFGAYSLTVEAFSMDATEVTNDKMIRVMQWAYGQGKLSVTAASVRNAEGNQQELLDLDDRYCRITWNWPAFGMKASKGSGYPCVEVSWYGAAAYCNYRSEMDGRTACYNLSDWTCNFAANGYRLPTNTEWEYAARGVLSGKRFPWGDTIDHTRANYYAYWSGGNPYFPYDQGYAGFDTRYSTGDYPYTSPAGAFAANGYGLCDMAGNVREWRSGKAAPRLRLVAALQRVSAFWSAAASGIPRDAALRALARWPGEKAAPRLRLVAGTVEELRKIDGVGQARAEKYGAELLAAMRVETPGKEVR